MLFDFISMFHSPLAKAQIKAQEDYLSSLQRNNVNNGNSFVIEGECARIDEDKLLE